MSRQQVDGPERLIESTHSICPQCKRVIDAQIVSRDNRVIMRKRCPQHGEFEALLFGDAALYTEVRRHPPAGPLTRATIPDLGAMERSGPVGREPRSGGRRIHETQAQDLRDTQ